MKKYWFLAMMCAICLEGLGRKYLPSVPTVAFYFIKDIVLLYGLVRLKPPEDIKQLWKSLYGGYGVMWAAAFGWTLIEMVNPENQSFVLALIGLRAYWLWWMAPVIIAGVLQDPKQKRGAIYILAILAIGISIFAMIQFVSPTTSAVNLYSVVDGEAQYADTAVVSTTGRARVSSTFSFISGFCDFTLLVPALLLSLGLSTNEIKLRRLALFATLISSAVVPMSGSRSSIVIGLAVLAITTWSAGLFFTAVGRRIIIGAIAGVVLATAAFPEALQGVQDRFQASSEETNERFLEMFQILPPVAMFTFDVPIMGLGTGMQQNARGSLHVYARLEGENENHRYLIELGPVGFCLVWMAKLGLMMVLLRARRILLAGGRMAAAGAAAAYAGLTFVGNLAFDHIWQALFFVGVGFILAEVITVLRERQAAAGVGPPPVTV